jgi:hypothetical protein
MVVCKLYNTAERKLWNNFLANSKSNVFLFEREFMEYHSDRFIDFSLLFFNDEKLIALLPASKNGATLSSHGGLTYGGLVIDKKLRSELILEIFDSMKAFLKEHSITEIIYKCVPYFLQNSPAQEDLYALILNNAKLEKRELSSIIKLEQRLSLSKGRKALVSKAKKNKVEIEISHEWGEFHNILSAALKIHGAAPVHSIEELVLLSSLYPNNVQLFIARIEDKIVACSMIFIFEDVTHTQYIATTPEGKDVGALDFLISELIEKAVESNKAYFSFGISTEDSGKYLNKGLLAQKESFGARTAVLDCYRLNVDD